MTVIEVYADITCPFTHVGLHRIAAERDARGRHDAGDDAESGEAVSDAHACS